MEKLHKELLDKSARRRRSLHKTYRDSTQIGLVLGAGVTAAHVPTYSEFALRLLERVLDERGVKSEWQRAFVRQQRDRLAADKRTFPPEVVLMLARLQWSKEGDPLPRMLVDSALWGQARKAHVISPTQTKRSNPHLDKTDRRKQQYALHGSWTTNETLNAIVTFCTSIENEQPIANPKVGAILTTNYDNLLEAAAHAKYRRWRFLKPVARTTSKEREERKKYRQIRQIPVIHIHGYLGFRERDHNPATKPLVTEQTDYFDMFYGSLGFGNYMAMAFLQRYPTIFIGSRMTDSNLRRLLHQIAKDSETGRPPNPAFAVMKVGDEGEDPVSDIVTDEILAAYGVATIWVKCFSKIKDVLHDTYVAGGPQDTAGLERMWKKLQDYQPYKQ